MGAAAADAWPTATTKAASAIAAIVAPTLNRFTDDVMENYFHLDEKDRRCALSRASNPVLSKRRAGLPRHEMWIEGERWDWAKQNVRRPSFFPYSMYSSGGRFTRLFVLSDSC